MKTKTSLTFCWLSQGSGTLSRDCRPPAVWTHRGPGKDYTVETTIKINTFRFAISVAVLVSLTDDISQ